MAEALPRGTTKEQAIAWGKANGARFDYLSEQRVLYATVERIPVQGLRFPCSEWNVTLTVMLDKDDRVLGGKVATVGSCV